jgi:hypothetical protein
VKRNLGMNLFPCGRLRNLQKDFKTDGLKIQPEFEKLGLKLGGLETNFKDMFFKFWFTDEP